ncbi:MAG: MlaD family protein [Planctomycetaceae bacterium]|nr:MlaD family protein [Planctomycetaceae bacterium]
MSNKHQELKVGLTVFTAIAALAVLIIMFGKGLPFHFGNEYTIKVRFQRTPGISVKSPVFKNGVEIGKVSNVMLVDDDREVEVSISLPKRRKIYTDEECLVRQTVIMGDASLDFVKKPNFQGKVELVGPDSPPLAGGVGGGGLLDGSSSIESDLSRAIENVSNAAVQVSELIGKVHQFIGTPQELEQRKKTIDAISREMLASLTSMRTMSDNVNLFVSNPKFQENTQKILDALPEVLEQAQQLIGETKKLVDKGSGSLDKIDGGLDKANKALEGVQTITDAISGDVPEVMKTLKNSSVKLEEMFDEITSIIKAVNQADGTVKRLMRDPEAYEKLMETLDNVQKITGELDLMLRTDIKPIANNVKIITDKVARDPSVFIRNLVNKPPRTKPLPAWGDGLGSDTLGSQTLNGFASESVYVPVSYDAPRTYQPRFYPPGVYSPGIYSQSSQPNCFQRFYSGIANTFRGGKNTSSERCDVSYDDTGMIYEDDTMSGNHSGVTIPQLVIPDAPNLAPAPLETKPEIKQDIPMSKPMFPVVIPKPEKIVPSETIPPAAPLETAPIKSVPIETEPMKTEPEKIEPPKPAPKVDKETAALPLVLTGLTDEDTGIIIEADDDSIERTASAEPVLRFAR